MEKKTQEYNDDPITMNNKIRKQKREMRSDSKRHSTPYHALERDIARVSAELLRHEDLPGSVHLDAAVHAVTALQGDVQALSHQTSEPGQAKR
jgi:hypothetical protein